MRLERTSYRWWLMVVGVVSSVACVHLSFAEQTPPVPENDPAVESLTPLWRGANFMEREVWDLFGIRFIDHPDLRRILLYDEFKGYPLRKDYPVNLVQPRVPERPVDGTFVDERSRNKLLHLQKSLGSKI